MSAEINNLNVYKPVSVSKRAPGVFQMLNKYLLN